jgi:hypothetical protein
VTDVWIAGERVVESRRLTRIDSPSLLARTKAWQARHA